MKHTISILYLEDDPGLGRLTQRVLARDGMDVELAQTGVQALSLASQNRYDAILVDYRLPVMNGLEVITSLMAEEETPPVIMITGEGNEALAVDAMKLGAADYLTKDSQSQFLNLAPMRIRHAIEQAQLKRDKLAAEEAQSQLIQELDAFAHTVAHDLKNPLQNVLLNLDRLKHDDAEKRAHVVELLRTELARSKQIVDGLLLLATVRKDELRLQDVSLGVGIKGALARLRPQVAAIGADITLPENWPRVLGRSDWLEEVWANLLSNTLKYGGDQPSVRVYWEEQPEMIVVYFEDNGPGVPEAIASKVFRPLPFTPHDEHAVTGTGLGLSIVARIIDRLSGEVYLDPGYTSGARFVIKIPMA
ncbi:MAG: response regulator [Bacteroidia bacterium]